MSLRRRLAPPPALTLLHDVAMAALSFPLSVWLRVGSFQSDLPFLRLGTLMFTACAAAVFIFAGMNRGVWRYVSLPDLLEIARAVSLTVLLFLALQFLTTRLEGYPRSAMLINWFVLIILLGAPRFGYRLLRDGNLGQLGQRARPLAVPVLLVGAGDAAEAFIRVTRRDAAAPYAVIGILDRGGGRVGRRIHGVPVLASLSEATAVLERLSTKGKAPQRFVLTDDGVDREGLRELVAIAEARGMTLARLPRMTELHHTDGNQQQTLMPVAVEDLLGRPRQVLDSAPMRELIAGKRILVTGAGGSIGSELARQIAGFAPARLALLDHSEFLLYEIDREIGALQPELARRAVLGDIRNRGRLESVFAEERPELVFHAAALKHVPLAEANPPEAVATNVLGTRQLAEVCLATGVDQMLLISTDKAVAPTSIMGAAKRAAELICQALDRQQRRRRQRLPLPRRALRQCAGLGRLGRAAVPGAARPRRAADRDRSGDDALFHDHARGGRAGAPGRRSGPAPAPAGRRLHARHGRARAHRRPCPADDPSRRQAARGRRQDRLHRQASGGEAA